MQKLFKYATLTDGVPSEVLLDAVHIQRGHPALNAPVDSLTDAQLLELNVCRVVVPPFPVDGYIYKNGAHVQQDGVWTATWEQQPTPNREERLYRRSNEARKDRNTALAQCDWSQLADAPLTTEQRAAWGVYRQALRDIPAQSTFPWEIMWPAKP